jgi:FkbM family methyltransferase
MKLKSFVPQKLYQQFIKPVQINYFESTGTRIYSQEGEDILIERIIGKKSKGFYIDIGAHHPFRYSNTCYFYKQGWSGINIEPNPDLFKYFLKHRKRDINLNIGLNIQPQELKYYSFDEPAMNTFSTETVKVLIASNYKLLRTDSIPTTTLAMALKDQPLPRVIDFMNIDTEGFDFYIIQSNDWERINPQFILIESIADNVRQVLDSELTTYLKSKNYEMISKLYNTIIFKKIE